MDALIIQLNRIEASNIQESVTLNESRNRLVQDAIAMAKQYLLDESGELRRDMFSILQLHGFEVSTQLTYTIRTTKGFLVFGPQMLLHPQI
jgi:hypothetical protein